ncbi:PREDICTED: gustatory receptor 8a-like [Rhagoletis zephyria]|uniref:gustatory receptor 8a-like n=1 Tax=Rhagoletis zephyria TaxID=28612 RepID=UPI0008116A7E|nr:PREDICTED: gustatory receptor 8a-like [Rhagoletis zephyria]
MFNRIPSVLRFYIRLFQFIGCFDASLRTQSNEQKLAEHRLVTWTNLLLLVFSLTTVNTFFRPHAFLFITESFGYFVDALKVCIAQLTVSIIYIETVFRRCALQRFWQKYALLNQYTMEGAQSRERNWPSQLRVHRRFLNMFWGVTVFDLIIQIVYLIFRQKNDHLLQFWAMFTPYTYIVHLRNMQIIFHIEIMRLELEKLRNDIGLLAEYTCFARRVVPFAGFEDFVRRKLAEKQLVFQHIHEMFNYFQQAFGVSSIAVLLMTYVRLVVDAYFMLYYQAKSWEFLGNTEIVYVLKTIDHFY